MSNEKRPCGRPRGSGKDDSPFLAQVADLLLSDTSLRPTTAMKRVIASRRDWRASDEALLRRWQVKWKKSGRALMEAALERTRPKRAAALAESANASAMKILPGDGIAWAHAIVDAQNSIKAMYDSLPTRQLEEAIKMLYDPLPFMQIEEAIKALHDPLSFKQIEDAMRAMYDPLPFKQLDEQFKALVDPSLFKGLDDAIKSLRDLSTIKLPGIF
jgi:hypothetical protein